MKLIIAIGAIIYGIFGTFKLFTTGDTNGAMGGILIGLGGVIMFLGYSLLGLIMIGVGIFMTFAMPSKTKDF